jgi:hypothetical protein
MYGYTYIACIVSITCGVLHTNHATLKVKFHLRRSTSKHNNKMSSSTYTSNWRIVSHKKVKTLRYIKADNSIYFYVFPCLFYPSVLCNYSNICSLKISKHTTRSLQIMLCPQRQRFSQGVRNNIFKSITAASCNLILWYTSSFLQTLYVYTCYSVQFSGIAQSI